MRVALVNTSDVKGGAARAAHRLHKGLRSCGVDSTYYVSEQTCTDTTIQKFIPDPNPDAVHRLAERKAAKDTAYQKYAGTRSPHIELFSHTNLFEDENVYVQMPRADIINLHWVSRFIDCGLFFSERIRKPAVWTLHDMNPFTGGCHYDQNCGKYKTACGACPLLGSDDAHDLSSANFNIKRDALQNWPSERLHIVTPSKWLAGVARSSALFSRFETTVIPNSLETDTFRPVDQAQARDALKLPANAQIVLFVSNHIGLARKGFRELAHALSLIPDTSRLMLLGVGDSHIKDFEAPFRVEQVEQVNSDATMAMVYAAADVMAIPSLQDNLPNTVLESLSCGTPVVGFEIGGIPDMITHGETGFLAPAGKVTELSLAFMEAFSDRERLRKIGQNGRALIEQHYTLETQGLAYKKLYEKVIAANPNL